MANRGGLTWHAECLVVCVKLHWHGINGTHKRHKRYPHAQPLPFLKHVKTLFFVYKQDHADSFSGRAATPGDRHVNLDNAKAAEQAV